MVDVPVDASDAVLISFPVPWGAIDADIENSASTEGRERRLYGGGFGDSLYGALELGVWTFVQDGLEGCFRASADVYHVDSRRELVGDLVGERMDVPHLVGEFTPQGVLVVSGGVGEPEG